jgi:hypothetical protein
MRKYNVYKNYAEVSTHQKHKIEERYAINNCEYPELEASFETEEEAKDYLEKCYPTIHVFKTCMIYYGMTEYEIVLEDDEDEDIYDSIDAKYIDLNDLD